MKTRGRQFGQENIEREIMILSQRLQENKLKRKNFYAILTSRYKEFSKNEIIEEIKKISYQTGLKEKFAEEFNDYVTKYFPYMISTDRKTLNKQIKQYFSQKELTWNGKSYLEIEEDTRLYLQSLLTGEHFTSKDFRKLIEESYQRKMTNSQDKFADLLFIRKSDGSSFFTEEEIPLFERHFFGEDYHQKL